MGNYIGSEKHKASFVKAQQAASEWSREQKRRRISLYNENPTRCKNCEQPIEYSKRKNIFCSSACSASVSNRQRTVSEESKQKTSKALLGRKAVLVHKDKSCKQCGCLIFRNRKFCSKKCAFEYRQNHFEYKRDHIKYKNYHHKYKRNNTSYVDNCKQCGTSIRTTQNHKFCSVDCTRKYRQEHPEEYVEYRKLLSKITKARVANGTHSGWKHRNKFVPSYPEKYFIVVLDGWKISYVREKKVGPYFIDFAIEDQQIAVEIDGKQHLLPERMEQDKKKDLLLSKNGWQVIRIRWYNPINDKNRELLHEQIENLKKILLLS